MARLAYRDGAGRAGRGQYNGRQWPTPSRSCCSPRRAATARAWTGPCRRSNARCSIHGAPVYVRKEIVHNKHVVEELSERGAIFVEETDEVPEERGLRVLRPRRRAERARGRRQRRLETIDATCPLVTKVHREAVRFAADGYTIVLVGHAGHEEVEGTMGEAPEQIVLVQDEHDVDTLEVEDPERIAYITQTTLAVDETTAILTRLRERFPKIVGPRTDDICYATTNRQAAVKQMAGSCDLMLVIGSRNSSNSMRLVEVARDCGTDALSDRQRRRGPGAVAAGAPRRRHLLRRERAREPRRRARRVLPRARRRATSPSSTSSRRTCASCSPSRSARPPRPGRPERAPTASARTRGAPGGAQRYAMESKGERGCGR